MEWRADSIKEEALQDHLNLITKEGYEVYGVYPVTHWIQGVPADRPRAVSIFVVVSRKG